MTAFASRNLKEILRDPLTLFFGGLFPCVLLGFFALMNKNIPVETFQLHMLTPGIAVFSLSFITLFSAQLISKDRSGAFMTRLLSTPLTSNDFLLGYFIPLLPLALLQGVVCFGFSVICGLSFSANIFAALVILLLVSFLYIGVGLLLGVSFTEKQVGGFFTLFVNLTTWLSGTWFDLALIGGAFETVSNLLPFSHAVNAVRLALSGDFAPILRELLWVIGYGAVIWVLAVVVFSRKNRV